MLLDGKRALITGGMGGLGAAIAEHFVKEGALVTVASRRAEVHDLQPESSTRKVCDHVDVTELASVQAAVDRAVARWHGLDIIVACAAVLATGKLQAFNAARFTELLQTNVIGTHNTIRAGAHALRDIGGGRMLTLSTAFAHTPTPGLGAFAATQAAIETLTATAAVELAGHNIRLNCLAPGIVDTGMGRTVTANDQLWPSHRERIALARPANPTEVAKAAAWLVSPANTYMTGQTIRLDGGLHLPPTTAGR